MFEKKRIPKSSWWFSIYLLLDHQCLCSFLLWMWMIKSWLSKCLHFCFYASGVGWDYLMTFVLCGEMGDWIPIVFILGWHLVQRCRESSTCTGMQLSLINPTWIQVTLCFLASWYLGIRFVLYCIPLVLTYVQCCLGFFSFLWTGGFIKPICESVAILNFKEMKWNTVVFAFFEIIKDKL